MTPSKARAQVPEPAERQRGPMALVRRLAEGLARLRGLKRALVALLLGALASGALPPLTLVFLLWPAFTGLLWLLDGARRKRDAFLVGWAFGVGHFLVGLYWVGIAFQVDAERYGALAPVAVLGLAMGMALFTGLAVLLAHWIATRLDARGLARVVLLAAAWLAVEWLRSWVLTGFPWNLIGTVWVFSDAMIQGAALAGVWGLSFFTIIVAAAPALLVEPKGNSRSNLGLAVALAVGLPLVVWAGGMARLSLAPAVGEAIVEGVQLRLVQPSIAQKLKWKAGFREKNVADQMRLSAGPGFEKVTHVIWAETAVPYFLADEDTLKNVLARIVPPGGLLLTGAVRRQDTGGGERLWNSLHALDAKGEIVSTYDKAHLVPFGEYVPFRSVFDFAKVTQGRTDFSPGPGRRTIALPGLPPFSPLICYEVIFSGRVLDRAQRPEWLLTITNDAWFGTSSGPYQHFASARLRSVEEGLPLVRVANNGITAVVDAYGRVWQSLGLNQTGVIDSPLPKPLSALTPYAIIGNWMVLILIIIAGIVCIVDRRRA